MDTTARIIEKRDLTDVTKLFVVHAPLVARNAAPGQFVILRVTETGERIPISITDFNRAAGTITIVVQEVGRTSALVGALEVGDTFLDFAGPLGAAVPLPEEGHAVLIGGGFGTGAVFPLARELRSRGVRVSSIVGARTRDLVILADLLATESDEVHVCTDDGSARLPRLRHRPPGGAAGRRRRVHALLRRRPDADDARRREDDAAPRPARHGLARPADGGRDRACAAAAG